MSTPSSPARARGIGSAVADRLAAEHDVLRVDLDPVAWTASSPMSPSADDRAAILDAVDGEIGVLVNNAGITKDARIVKMTEEQFLAVIRVNLGAAYELTTARDPALRRRRDRRQPRHRAYLGNFGQFNYCASKGGLVGMTRALALQLAPQVRVNAIAPTSPRAR